MRNHGRGMATPRWTESRVCGPSRAFMVLPHSVSALRCGMTHNSRRSERLLPRMRRLLRTRRYSPRTLDVYAGWVRRFIEFHGRRHPRELGEREIAEYLSSLATTQRVA